MTQLTVNVDWQPKDSPVAVATLGEFNNGYVYELTDDQVRAWRQFARIPEGQEVPENLVVGDPLATLDPPLSAEYLASQEMQSQMDSRQLKEAGFVDPEVESPPEERAEFGGATVVGEVGGTTESPAPSPEPTSPTPSPEPEPTPEPTPAPDEEGGF